MRRTKLSGASANGVQAGCIKACVIEVSRGGPLAAQRLPFEEVSFNGGEEEGGEEEGHEEEGGEEEEVVQPKYRTWHVHGD